MPSIVSRDPCVICGVNESVMHSHHTVPRSRGGENSQQIILCGSCHGVLHANAVYIVSCIRNSNRARKTFWNTEQEARNAEPWLQILVKAILTPDADSAAITKHPVGALLSDEDFRLFKALAKDLGCSQENAVEYCIRYVLLKKGLKNEKAQSDLWFLPVSHKR